ncbi:MAG: DUF1998 domain-containing protein, partial [Myxococcales bacterium]|nr:DUF1998 domain-containing protein [Myxococcales bacterium]
VGREPEHHTWVRSPASALTELAPFNTFYASARRVEIDGVDLKKEAPPTRWRFCQSCHHARPFSSADAPEDQCPSCGDGRWGDIGQAREVLELGQVFAVAQHRDAVLGDDGDDRDRKYYEKISLFEAATQARDAWSNETAGFGFELQPQMVLRQLNLGRKDDGRSAPMTQLAGQAVPDVRFVLCGVCGQAQEPAPPPGSNKRAHPRHRAWCPERKKPLDKQVSRELHLLRELRSEALRMVVPFAEGDDVAKAIANLRAALRVGLRRFYGGDPDFLEVQAYDEPLPAREGRRRFLVIMDRVPGGTGLLAELCTDKGAKLKEALEQAHDTLRSCPCQHREPAVKACYQCLYAYRESEDFTKLDRGEALSILERVMDAFGALGKVDSVGTMNQSAILESELEVRFLRELERQVVASHGTFEGIHDGAWRLSLGARSWLLRAQVELGTDKVRVPCRADFMLYPEQPGRSARPVAVFTDGLAYHVMPGQAHARLADDARKRLGVSLGGELLSWSLSWKDVVSPESPAVPRWVGDGSFFTGLQSMAFKLDTPNETEKLGTLLRILDSDPMRALVAYLQAPTRLATLASLAAFALVQHAGKRQPSARVAGAHAQWRESEVADDLPLVSSEGDTVTTQLGLGTHARLLLAVDATKLGTLLTDPGAASVTLRLEDDLAARNAGTFELSWRLWLRAWNLLQALPGAVFTTRGATQPAELADDPATTTPRAASAVASPTEIDARLPAVNEIGDEAAVRVVTEVLTRHRGVPAPDVPLELRAPAYAVSGDVEFGWPDRRVAAYFDHQGAEADALRAAGWTVFAIERGLSVDALEQALGVGEGS